MLVDTNIVISALFYEGNERRLVGLLSKDGGLVLSEAVLHETRYVAAGWPDGKETTARFETRFRQPNHPKNKCPTENALCGIPCEG